MYVVIGEFKILSVYLYQIKIVRNSQYIMSRSRNYKENYPVMFSCMQKFYKNIKLIAV